VNRQTELTSRLTESLAPVHLEVVNESHMHNVPKGSETHLGKSRIDRHRAVQRALGDQFRAGLHALTITAMSPDEWRADPTSPASPPCLGGSKAGT
jgi:BolA family transcriptional regulator, general stress-responsive regulator